MHIFFFLSLYSIKESYFSQNPSKYLPNNAYGFVKNSNVFINITSTASLLVFGFASKEEMKKIDSLDLSDKYCEGKEQLSEYQFLVQSNFSITFTTTSKKILTPFYFSCDEFYLFNLELDIVNGKNHLDYRYQSLSTLLLAFGFIFLFLFVLFTIIIIYLHNAYKYSYSAIIYDLFILFACLQVFMIYSDIHNNKNNEFIDFTSIDFLLMVFQLCSLMILVCIDLLANNFHNYLYTIKDSTLVKTLYAALFLFLLFGAQVIMDSFKDKEITFSISSVFYLFSLGLICFSPYKITLTKVIIIVYFMIFFFVYIMNPFYYSDYQKIHTCSIYWSKSLITIIVNFIASVLLIVGFYYFNDLSFKEKVEDENDSENNSINVSLEGN